MKKKSSRKKTEKKVALESVTIFVVLDEDGSVLNIFLSEEDADKCVSNYRISLGYDINGGAVYYTARNIRVPSGTDIKEVWAVLVDEDYPTELVYGTEKEARSVARKEKRKAKQLSKMGGWEDDASYICVESVAVTQEVHVV